MKINKISALVHLALFSGSVSLGAAIAQESEANDTDGQPEAESIERISVTGSRIRRVDMETSTPVSVIDSAEIEARGYTNVAEAMLNSPLVMGSNTPENDLSGSAVGSGQYFINLSNLGSQRTLTLVNGRRMVSTNSAGNGAGANQVDASIIPVGLIERIEILQVGGAAVYGSDAISGVVNYILKSDFEGFEFDAQYSDTEGGDFGVTSLRATAGKNFYDQNANISLNVEYTDSPALYATDRRWTRNAYSTAANPNYEGPGSGTSARIGIHDHRFSEHNAHGTLFTIPAPLPQFRVNHEGGPLQFDSSGNLVPFDPGTYYQPAFADGGDGYSRSEMMSLQSGIERLNINLLGHKDFDNNMRLSTELLFSEVNRVDPLGTQLYNTTLLTEDSAAIPFTPDNPFLTDQARDVLLNSTYFLPGAGEVPYVGQPIYLSKAWEDLVHSRAIHSDTETWRALVSLQGDLDIGERNYYWEVSGSWAETSGKNSSWSANPERFWNALNVTSDNGQIVCAGGSADGCAPLNPFGNGNVSDAARDYVSVLIENGYDNTQTNFLATLGGTLTEITGGEILFSVGYEYRKEEADFIPNEAARLGEGRGQPVIPISGDYNTHEISAELDIPLIGAHQEINGVQALDWNIAARFVDNSLADEELVWNTGLNWRVNNSLLLRATAARSFRTPSLTELLLPERTQMMSAGTDPCDQRNIDDGAAPGVRRANCQAMFDALGIDGSNFTSEAQNITFPGRQSGNPNLESETADSYSLGFVWQPEFANNLTISLDHIDIEITNAIEPFTLENALQVCYDSTQQPDDICGLFTRDEEGQIRDAVSSYVNAGYVRYRGQNLSVFYGLDFDFARLDINFNTTHVSLLERSVSGFEVTKSHGTVSQPSYRSQLNMQYTQGPVRVGYFVDYMPNSKQSYTASIDTTPTPRIASNILHSMSVHYEANSNLSLRAGVQNLFDNEPSYPTVSYGDILGRRFYAGVNYRF